MVEWFKALVLKTSEVQASVGSNPTLSATILPRLFRRVFYYGSAMLYFEYGEKELNYLKKKDKRLAAVIEKPGLFKENYTPIFSSRLLIPLRGSKYRATPKQAYGGALRNYWAALLLRRLLMQ